MNLKKLEQSNEQWFLEEFVEVANQLLPDYLPDVRGNTKVKEEINPRLVRHYTSQKLLDEPSRSGKYAVYTYRHLLQLLLVRRLLSEGIGSAAINDLVTSKTNEQLKSLLTGGIQIYVTTAHPSLNPSSNSALEYLEKLGQGNKTKRIQESIPSPTHFPLRESIQQENQPLNQPTEWTRIEVLDGLEINLRSDFVYPNSLREQQALTQHIIQQVSQLLTRKKP
jgi:DNA-binding transcriptional MerR regulator